MLVVCMLLVTEEQRYSAYDGVTIDNLTGRSTRATGEHRDGACDGGTAGWGEVHRWYLNQHPTRKVMYVVCVM